MSKTVTPQARCQDCRRPLSAAASIAAGRGRVCKARNRAAALARALEGCTPTQAGKATELIRDGGIVPTSQPAVWRTVSSDGEVIYLTTLHECSCPASRYGRLCYHVAAARVLTEAAKAA